MKTVEVRRGRQAVHLIDGMGAEPEDVKHDGNGSRCARRGPRYS